MKRFTLSILAALFLLTGFEAHSQATIYFSGLVSDLNGSIMPGHPVYVQDSLSGNIDTAITNSGGYYNLWVTFPSSIGQATVFTYDCNQVMHSALAHYSNQGFFNNDFSICNGCSTNYTYVSDSLNNVQFTSYVTGTAPFTYNWDFGDGQSSTLPNPLHTYANSSAYGVILTVTDSTGCVSALYDTVYVNYCSAFFIASVNGNVAFFNSYASGSGNALTHSWDFGDGTMGYGANPTHTYLQTGTFTVCLTVTDSFQQCTSTYCDSIIISTVPSSCQPIFTYLTNHDTVTFGATVNSTGPHLFFWDFGDGHNGSGQNPIHVYNTSGSYYVCLTVVDSLLNCTDTFCMLVYVQFTSPCQASFSYLPISPNVVIFDAQPNGATGPYAYSWDFGNGGTSHVEDPVYTYSHGGAYWVCLTVTDTISGCTSTVCQSVYVNGTCQAAFTWVGGGPTVQFNGSGSGPSGGGFYYSWNFGDGHYGSGQNPVHIYNTSGTYNVCLTVTDSFQSCIDTVCHSITVIGQPNCSTYFYTTPDTVNGGVYINGSMSGVSPFTYSWTVNGIPQGNTTSTLYLNTNGWHLICLTGVDSTQCTATYCDSVFVGCSAVPSFNALGLTAYFQNFSTGGTQYLWHFGDGDSSTAYAPTHTYAQPGVYTACLTITDSNLNCTSTACIVVYVININCQASFGYADSFGTVYFWGQATGANQFTYSWDFGDGHTGYGQYPVHQYNVAGIYTVCMIATDSILGCTDTVCNTITVGPPIGNCQANWSYVDSFGTVHFWANGGGQAPVTYTWDFGDNHFGSGQYPVHTYSNSGSYLVCLYTSDSTGNCTDTVCLLIYVQIQSSCQAYFNMTPDSTGGVFCTAQPTGTAPFSYQWFLNGALYSTASSIYIQTAGNSLICLTITDSTGCTDTYCDTTSIGCDAQFGFTTNNMTVNFYNYSTGGPVNWSFGDGTASSANNPVHTYQTPGTYTVCLYINNPASQCFDSICKTVTVPDVYTISGKVFTSNMVADYATAYLIEFDSAAGTLTSIGTYSIHPSDSGEYHFTGVVWGDYLVKVALDTISPSYANFLPTYYGDVLFWNQAPYIHVGPSTSQAHINMIAGNNPGGPGFIGGLVSQGANKANGPGDPVPEVSVIILDDQDNAITHTVSDINGTFGFPYLAWGTYKIYVEIPGKYSNPHIVTIGPNNPSINDLIFKVNKNDVTTGLLTFGVPVLENVEFYPNPVTNIATVEITLERNTGLNIQILDISGRIVKQVKENAVSGENYISLDLQELYNGIYMINIKTDEGKQFSDQLIKMN